jgi:3-methyladenine DNA glycosylase/8-oxoguanine DNA glycosylase
MESQPTIRTVAAEREFRRQLASSRPVALRITLRPLQRGPYDPAMRVVGTSVWRATRTPDGTATVHLQPDPSTGRTEVTAWGEGADWVLEHAPGLCGLDDDDSSFRPEHPLIRDLHRRFRGLRISRSSAVMEALVPTILEQKVPGAEARRSYRRLVRRYGEAAPGPAGGPPLNLMVPPSALFLAGLPSYAFHPLGVERTRADTIRRAGAVADRLEETAAMPADAARRRFLAVPGIGPWSAAEVAAIALGDPDAVSVGDFHLPHLVSWNLAGEPRGDDARMLELLEPFAGHRGRVIRLLEAAAPHAPRFGPRVPLKTHI